MHSGSFNQWKSFYMWNWLGISHERSETKNWWGKTLKLIKAEKVAKCLVWNSVTPLHSNKTESRMTLNCWEHRGSKGVELGQLFCILKLWWPNITPLEEKRFQQMVSTNKIYNQGRHQIEKSNKPGGDEDRRKQLQAFVQSTFRVLNPINLFSWNFNVNEPRKNLQAILSWKNVSA